MRNFIRQKQSGEVLEFKNAAEKPNTKKRTFNWFRVFAYFQFPELYCGYQPYRQANLTSSPSCKDI